MKTIIYIYYILFIVSGGFRHYDMDFSFWKTIQEGEYIAIPLFLNVTQIAVVFFSFLLLLFPLVKEFHLLFGLILFAIDCYFQNNVSFISSQILPNLFPFFFYAYLRYSTKSEKVNGIIHIAIYFIVVGYFTAFCLKMRNGWLNFDNAVIEDYIEKFNNSFMVPTILGQEILSVKSHIFWKLTDYLILLYQGSFIFVFYKKNIFHVLSFFSVLFHILILLLLGISVFYVYILFYAFIYALINIYQASGVKSESFILEKYIDRFWMFLFIVLFSLFALGKFDAHFFNNLLSYKLWVYSEYIYNFICILIWFYFYQKVIFSSKQNSHIT